MLLLHKMTYPYSPMQIMKINFHLSLPITEIYIDSTACLCYNHSMATIHDVAQIAGVSVASVSRTFSSPELMNEQTRLRVLEAARSLNYRPRQRRTPVSVNSVNMCVGFQFVASDFAENVRSNDFYAPMLAGVEAEASARGLHLMLHTTNRHAVSQELPRMIVEQAVGGILLLGTADPAILNAIAGHVPPIVLLDNRDETGQYESILSDGFGGAYAAVQYLLQLGHRQIGFYVMCPETTTFRDRLRGYRAALFEAGIVPDNALVVSGRHQTECARGFGALMRSAHRPTAIVAANDAQALDIMRLSRQTGLKIPDDLSLIGFDDIPFSIHAHPPLTTMRVDKEFMGRLAVRRLYARMQAARSIDPPEPAASTHIPVTLIIRDSCRAV
jgi:DNA-binding LacI/PurR family transcriptional regulator